MKSYEAAKALFKQRFPHESEVNIKKFLLDIGYKENKRELQERLELQIQAHKYNAVKINNSINTYKSGFFKELEKKVKEPFDRSRIVNSRGNYELCGPNGRVIFEYSNDLPKKIVRGIYDMQKVFDMYNLFYAKKLYKQYKEDLSKEHKKIRELEKELEEAKKS